MAKVQPFQQWFTARFTEYLHPNDPTRNCHGCLLHPQAAFDNLFDRIRMSVNRGHEIELIIRD